MKNKLGKSTIAVGIGAICVFTILYTSVFGITKLREKANDGPVFPDAPAETLALPVDLEAEGWGDDSTPIILHVEGEYSDQYVTVYKNEADGYTIDLPKDRYHISAISPINADGSIYNTPEPTVVLIDPFIYGELKADFSDNFPDEAEGHEENEEDGILHIELDKIPADQVTPDQIESIQTEVDEAIDKSDLDPSLADTYAEKANA